MAKKHGGDGQADAVPVAPDAPIEANGAAPSDSVATVEAPAPIKRRKRRRLGVTERDYWVTGRANPNDTWDRIMRFGTKGRARKGIELVRHMPAYRRHELRIERCVVVE